MNHECAAIGCGKTISGDMLMCAAHWRMVPAGVQARVWASWRSFQRIPATNHLMFFERRRAYLTARQAAIDSISIAA